MPLRLLDGINLSDVPQKLLESPKGMYKKGEKTLHLTEINYYKFFHTLVFFDLLNDRLGIR